jgi:hypothetical protein
VAYLSAQISFIKWSHWQWHLTDIDSTKRAGNIKKVVLNSWVGFCNHHGLATSPTISHCMYCHPFLLSMNYLQRVLTHCRRLSWSGIFLFIIKYQINIWSYYNCFDNSSHTVTLVNFLSRKIALYIFILNWQKV